MSEQSEITVQINEARIAIDAALALADLVAQHEIVQSQSFNQLVIFLNDAAEAISRVGDGAPVKREASLQRWPTELAERLGWSPMTAEIASERSESWLTISVRRWPKA